MRRPSTNVSASLLLGTMLTTPSILVMTQWRARICGAKSWINGPEDLSLPTSVTPVCRRCTCGFRFKFCPSGPSSIRYGNRCSGNDGAASLSPMAWSEVGLNGTREGDLDRRSRFSLLYFGKLALRRKWKTTVPRLAGQLAAMPRGQSWSGTTLSFPSVLAPFGPSGGILTITRQYSSGSSFSIWYFSNASLTTCVADACIATSKVL